MKKLLIIPAHNEEGNIGRVIQQSRELEGWDVIIIDCASTDRTIDEIKKSHSLVGHIASKNQGLALNLRAAFRQGIDRGYDYIATCDADGEYDPREIQQLYKKINKRIFCVVGRRFEQATLKDKVLAQIIKSLYKEKVIDPKSGERIYNAKILSQLLVNHFESTHYGLSLELIMHGLKQGEKVLESKLKNYHKKRERILIDPAGRNREVMDIIRIIGRGNILDGERLVSEACSDLKVDANQWREKFQQGTEQLILIENGVDQISRSHDLNRFY